MRGPINMKDNILRLRLILRAQLNNKTLILLVRHNGYSREFMRKSDRLRVIKTIFHALQLF